MLGIITLAAIILVGAASVRIIEDNKKIIQENKKLSKQINFLIGSQSNSVNDHKMIFEIIRDTNEKIDEIPKVVRVATKEEIRNSDLVKIRLQ